MDGTLIQPWAGHKSFVRKKNSDDDTPPDDCARPREDWRSDERSNETNESSTDSQVKLFRKSRNIGAMLCYMGHPLTDDRHASPMRCDLLAWTLRWARARTTTQPDSSLCAAPIASRPTRRKTIRARVALP